MKKVIIFYCILCAFLLIDTPVNAGAYSMGRIQSVSSDKVFDVIRNPAIIATQKESHALGLFLSYQVYSYYNIDYDYHLVDYSAEKYGSDFNDTIVGNATIAYCTRVGKGAFGIAATTNDFNLLGFDQEKNEYEGTDTGPIDFTNDWTMNAMKINPAIAFSVGFPITSESSLGIQLISGYSIETISQEMNFTNTPPPSVSYIDEKFVKRTDTITNELAIGYFRNEGNSQIGFILKSGKICARKKTINYDWDGSIPAPATFDGDDEIDYFFLTESGVNLTIGAYLQPVQFLGITLEAVYTFPNTYGNNDFIAEPDPLISNYDEYSVRINEDSIYSIKGGVEFYLNLNFTISAGGGIEISKNDVNGRFDNDTETTTIISTLGVDYNFTGGSRIFAGTQLSLIYTDRNHDNDSTMTSIFGEINGETDSLKLDVYLGMSFAL